MPSHGAIGKPVFAARDCQTPKPLAQRRSTGSNSGLKAGGGSPATLSIADIPGSRAKAALILHLDPR